MTNLTQERLILNTSSGWREVRFACLRYTEE
jgi:hypothetical protein